MINYKKRINEGLENIIAMCDAKEKKNLSTPLTKRIKSIAQAQLGNLRGVENKA